MRRFVSLLVVLFFSIPFGISVSGCSSKGATVVFCDGGNTGPIVGQLTTMTLNPQVFGISLNAGAFGQVTPPTGADCKGSTVALSNVLYGVRQQDVGLVDIVPSGVNAGKLCAGRFNRNTGGGVPDFTVCTPTTRSGIAYVSASSGTANSNALPIFVHPVVTAITVGPPSTNCATDLATNCCAFSTVNSVTAPTGKYDANSCLSQNVSGQLAARVFAGNGDALQNVTCTQTGTDSAGRAVYSPLVGHVTYTAQDTNVVTIDENGIATAKYPGATVVNGTIANGNAVIASSTSGYFSTCPPASITLTPTNAPNGSATSVTVTQNNTQPLTAVVQDTRGATLSGVPLTFVSSTPRTLPNSTTGSATPTFPGSGEITAVCNPPACNNAPLNQLGLFGNGKAVTSNPVTINTPGTNSSILFTASTQSLSLNITDLATNTAGTTVRLPFLPNSMVLSTDGNTLYMGSSTELMVVASGTGAIAGQFIAARGQVLAVSPDNTTVVVSDPSRQLISLVSSAGAVTSTYGGVGTRAVFSPDSATVYIAAGDQLIAHSTYTGWRSVPLSTTATDITIGNPSVGVFLAGATTTARGYCPVTTVSGSGLGATTSNAFYPDAGVAAETTDRLAATNDGLHVFGATVTPAPTFVDLRVTSGTSNTPGLPVGACPDGGLRFNATAIDRTVLPGVTASAITGVYPATDSSFAFVTYLGSGGVLPLYTPNGSAAGALSNVPLSGSAGAPVAGVLSSDNGTFFVGTAGDGLVHLVTRGSSGFTDTSTLDPRLLDDTGHAVPANLLQQRPRRTT